MMVQRFFAAWDFCSAHELKLRRQDGSSKNQLGGSRAVNRSSSGSSSGFSGEAATHEITVVPHTGCFLWNRNNVTAGKAIPSSSRGSLSTSLQLHGVKNIFNPTSAREKTPSGIVLRVG